MRLRHAPPEQCARLLERGDVRRTMPAGPMLVGYWLCCPSCGRTYPYLHSQVTYVESAEWTRTEWRGIVVRDSDDEVDRVVSHPVALSAESEFACYGCGQTLKLRENELSAG